MSLWAAMQSRSMDLFGHDMDGHAAKAKELLDQAYTEIKLAAEAANQNKK